MWAGARLSKTKPGQVSVPVTGFFRGTTKTLRVAAGGLAGTAVAGLLTALADYLNSTPLAYLSVGICVLSIGVAWGAMFLGRASES
jgi:hypothetical protein